MDPDNDRMESDCDCTNDGRDDYNAWEENEIFQESVDDDLWANQEPKGYPEDFYDTDGDWYV